jgi:hypothetical protein
MRRDFDLDKRFRGDDKKSIDSKEDFLDKYEAELARKKKEAEDEAAAKGLSLEHMRALKEFGMLDTLKIHALRFGAPMEKQLFGTMEGNMSFSEMLRQNRRSAALISESCTAMSNLQKPQVDDIAAIWLARRVFDRLHPSPELPPDFWKYVTYDNYRRDNNRNYVVCFVWQPVAAINGSESFLEVCVSAVDGTTTVIKALPLSTYSLSELVPYRK